MNYRAAATSILLGYIAYLALTLIAGNSGIREYQALLQQHQSATEYGAQLENQQKTLTLEVSQLQHNRERILVEARKAGYYPPSEYVVRLHNHQRVPEIHVSSQYHIYAGPQSDNRPLLAAISFSLAGIVYALIVLFKFSWVQ